MIFGVLDFWDFGFFGRLDFHENQHIHKSKNPKFQIHNLALASGQKYLIFGFLDFAAMVLAKRAVLVLYEHCFALSVGHIRNESYMVGRVGATT